MQKIFTIVLCSLLVCSVAITASPASGASPRRASSRMERVLARKLARMRRPVVRVSSSSRSSSSVRSSAVFTKPATRSSSSSYSYTGTPVRGVLQIDQVATGSARAAAGTDGVTLISFDATVANEDVTLSTLKFTATEGSLTAATQYELLAQASDGTWTRVAFSGAPAGDVLVFGNLQFLLRQAQTRRFLVQGRLRTGGSATSLALGFHVTDPLFVQARGLTYGRDLAPGIQVDSVPCTGQFVCRVLVHTRPARSVSVSGLGNLFVTRDSVPVPSRQFLLGRTSDPLIRLTFHATEEDVLVTSLSLLGFADSVTGLALFTEGSSTPFATARQLQCDVTVAGQFCARAASGLFTVPEDGEIRIHARALTNGTREGGTSGESVTPSLSVVTTGAVAVKAQGKSSGRVLEQNDGDATAEGEIIIGRDVAGANASVTASTHDAVAAKITSIDNAATDPDQTAVPFGTAAFAKFRFSVAPNDNSAEVTLKTLVFTVTASNVQVDQSALRLFNPASPSVTAPCSSNALTGTITVTCANLDASALNTEIDQGGSLTLGLQSVLYPGNSAGTSILQTTLGNLGNRDASGGVEWTDGTTVFDWVDVPVTQVRSTQYRS